mmetsp:Transcript_35645/g.83396  ORF Transcript_35645/g.83396 Transcript_35645/m.83396 type:complete len:289 (+) Transcript_35645:363-1229(+)
MLPLHHVEGVESRAFKGQGSSWGEDLHLEECPVRVIHRDGVQVALRHSRVEVIIIDVHGGEVGDCEPAIEVVGSEPPSGMEGLGLPCCLYQSTLLEARESFPNEASHDSLGILVFLGLVPPPLGLLHTLRLVGEGRHEQVIPILIVCDDEDLPNTLVGRLLAELRLQLVDVCVHIYCTVRVRIAKVPKRSSVRKGSLDAGDPACEFVLIVENCLTLLLRKLFHIFDSALLFQLKGLAPHLRPEGSKETLDGEAREGAAQAPRFPALANRKDCSLNGSPSGCHPNFLQF